jgi:flavin reductase (DIM6/NTAB) family NADH-FMN oxidoreductase RutF
MPGPVMMLEPTIRDLFREAMRGVASTVFLITTRAPDGNAGMTATAVCSLSFDPVSVLVCVNRATAFMNAVEASGRFVVNILSREDEAVAKAFGSAAGREHRFMLGDWYDLDGLPALRSSMSAISCEVAGHMDFGSHRVLVGEVRQVDNHQGRAELLYCQGEYHSLQPRPWRMAHQG